MPITKGTKKMGGRKKGIPNKKTLEQKAVLNEVKQRIMQNADVLLNSQLTIAKGCSYLYKLPRNGRGKPVLIKDQKTIEDYLMGKFENGASDYYMLTTERPDNQAIIDMLNRALGKPSERFEDEEGKAITGIVFLPNKQ